MEPSQYLAAQIEDLRPIIDEFVEQFVRQARENADRILENLKKSQAVAPPFWHVTPERKAAIKLVLDLEDPNFNDSTWEEENAARNVLCAMLDEVV